MSFREDMKLLRGGGVPRSHAVAYLVWQSQPMRRLRAVLRAVPGYLWWVPRRLAVVPPRRLWKSATPAAAWEQVAWYSEVAIAYSIVAGTCALVGLIGIVTTAL